jgi:hypothetical protein
LDLSQTTSIRNGPPRAILHSACSLQGPGVASSTPIEINRMRCTAGPWSCAEKGKDAKLPEIRLSPVAALC